MKLIPFLIFLLASCTPREVKIAEDVISGEIKVVETVIEDFSPTKI